MNKDLRDPIPTLVMHPNGKQPLSASSSWKPSDGYIEPRTPKVLQRIALVIGLVALGIGLTAWSQA